LICGPPSVRAFPTATAQLGVMKSPDMTLACCPHAAGVLLITGVGGDNGIAKM
jgi:hypothetical protein